MVGFLTIIAIHFECRFQQKLVPPELLFIVFFTKVAVTSSSFPSSVFPKIKKNKNKPRVNAIEIFSSFLPLVDCRSNIGKSFISYTQLTPLLADTVGNVFVTILPPENKREEIKYQNTWILISASKLSELSSSDEDTTEAETWDQWYFTISCL